VGFKLILLSSTGCRPGICQHMKVIDEFVSWVGPSDKKSTASMSSASISVCVLPMVFLTRTPLQMRTTALLLLNIFLRLLFPSSYYPATASSKGFFASPVTHRCIAFVAEFSMYEIWAMWAGVDYWGPTYLWLFVFINECISTLGVLLQWELLLFTEDSIWFLHTSYMCYLSLWQWKQMVFFGGFGLALGVVHLPRRFALLISGGRADVLKKSGAKHVSLLYMNPLLKKGGLDQVKIRPCDKEEKAWVVPMLLGIAFLMTVMYYDLLKS